MTRAVVAAIADEDLSRHHQTPGEAHFKYYTIKWASPCTTLLWPHVSYFTFSPSNGGGGPSVTSGHEVTCNPPAASPLACLPGLVTTFLFLGGVTATPRGTCAHFARVSWVFGACSRAPL